MEGNGSVSTGLGGSGGVQVSSTPTFDASFETSSMETTSQAPVTTPDPITTELTINNQSMDEFVHSEKPAHEKLVDLSQMEDSEVVKEVKADLGKQDTDRTPDKKDVSRTNEPTIEQKIMLLQAEALKLLAGKSGEKNDKEMADLLKKLKKIIDEMQENGEGVSAHVLRAVLGMFMQLSKAGETGVNHLDKELKRSKRKN